MTIGASWQRITGDQRRHKDIKASQLLRSSAEGGDEEQKPHRATLPLSLHQTLSLPTPKNLVSRARCPRHLHLRLHPNVSFTAEEWLNLCP